MKTPVARPPAAVSIQGPAVAVAGVPFDKVTAGEALDRIEQMICSGRFHHVVTANVHFLVQARRDAELHRVLCEAHLVVCDGMPIRWASFLFGNRLPERIAGVDLSAGLLQLAERKGYRVFFLGGAPHVAEQAIANIRRKHPDILIGGSYSPPMVSLEEMDDGEICRRVLVARPDVLFVCLGCPKSEKWIARYGPLLECPVVIGVGATIDFLANRVKRAPLWMQRSGLEWLFRMLQEPRRLARRYLGDLCPFIRTIASQWFLHSKAWEWITCYGGGRATDAFLAEAIPVSVHGNSRTFMKITGRIDKDAAASYSHLITQAMGTEQRCCILDVSEVSSIDSTGVAMLLRLHRDLCMAGRLLVLVAPGAPLRRVLRMMRLEDILHVARSEEAALQLVREPE